MNTKKMLCLVDGEHYLPVTKSSIKDLDQIDDIEVVALVFIGGTEKLRETNEDEFSKKMGKPVYFGSDHHNIPYNLIEKIIKKYNIDIVMDLSDEPVINYAKRFKIASLILSLDIPYQGPDFKFEPLTQANILKKPSIKILGTGKRIGKTGVSAYAARLIHKHKYNPCIIAMGRGGPEKPEIVKGNEINITPEFLMEQSNKGVHAASDHWEDALMSRVLTIGCRRCGGGMLGEVFKTNMIEGASLANDVDADLVILEGSGAAIPPIKTDKNISIIGVNQPIDNIKDYFGPFRIKLGDLVVLTMCEEPMADEDKILEVIEFIKEVNPGVTIIPTVFRPKPLNNIENKNVLFATTAPDSVKDVLIDYLEENYNCNIVGVTPHLSNRPLLQADIEKYIDEVDLILTELKAAAVDVVTKDSLEAGLDVVYCDNIPIVIDEKYDNLDEAIIKLVDSAIDSFNNT